MDDKNEKEDKLNSGKNSPKKSPRLSETESQQRAVPKRLVFLGALLLILAGLIYYFRSLFVAAIVNGEPVFRWTVVQELEERSGQQALDSIVTRKLIRQEAERQGVAVSGEEVEAELDRLRETLSGQGQNLESVLELQGLTLASLRDQIRLQLLVEKMAGEVEVSQEEIDQHIEDNQDLISEDLSEEEVETLVREQLEAQKAQELGRDLVGDLQSQADIRYFVDYQ